MIKIICEVCKSELPTAHSIIACNSGIFRVSPCQTCCELARQDGRAEVQDQQDGYLAGFEAGEKRRL